MSAKVYELVRDPLKALVKVKISKSSAGTLRASRLSRIVSKYERRSAVELRELARYDSQHALVPVLAIYNDRAACISKRPSVRSCGALELRSCLIENLGLDLLALIVLPRKILRGSLRLSRVILEEELQSISRIVKPSRRIDPRNEIERDKSLIQSLARRQEHLVHHAHADIGRIFHALKSTLDNCSVLIGNRYKVSDRCKSRKLDCLTPDIARDLILPVLAQSLNELQRNARAAKIDERICVVRPLRADNAVSRRQFILNIVVVSNDDLNAAALKLLHRINIRNAAVYGNNEIRLLLNDLVHDLLGQAIAVFRPVRHDVINIYRVAPEITHKDRCRSNAVAVVIAVNKDLSMAVDRLINNVDSLAHVIIKERIVPDTVILRQKLLY